MASRNRSARDETIWRGIIFSGPMLLIVVNLVWSLSLAERELEAESDKILSDNLARLLAECTDRYESMRCRSEILEPLPERK